MTIPATRFRTLASEHCYLILSSPQTTQRRRFWLAVVGVSELSPTVEGREGRWGGWDGRWMAEDWSWMPRHQWPWREPRGRCLVTLYHWESRVEFELRGPSSLISCTASCHYRSFHPTPAMSTMAARDSCFTTITTCISGRTGNVFVVVVFFSNLRFCSVSDWRCIRRIYIPWSICDQVSEIVGFGWFVPVLNWDL